MEKNLMWFRFGTRSNRPRVFDVVAPDFFHAMHHACDAISMDSTLTAHERHAAPLYGGIGGSLPGVKRHPLNGDPEVTRVTG